LNYYVYYKIDPQKVEEMRPKVQALFSRLERDCGVKGRWMRRRDDPSTYMEVYEEVKDSAGFDAAMSRASLFFAEERRVERFISAGRPA